MEFVLTGTRVSQVTPSNHRNAAYQVPAFSVTSAGGRTDQLGVQRQHAPVFRQSLFLALKRSIFNVIDFEDGGGADDFLDAPRVVYAGQLY